MGTWPSPSIPPTPYCGADVPARHDAPAGKKWCPYCERFRAKVDFQVNRSRADGLQPRCRDCHNATRTAETRQRLNADEYAAHLRLTEAHPEEWERYLEEARTVIVAEGVEGLR